MYKLFYYPGNANLAPHMVLEEIGAPHELVLVDRDRNAHKSPEYLKLNPNGRIPVLIDDDLVLYETAAICLHLADRHPEAGLAPALGTAQRAQFYKWLVFLTNTIQPDLMSFFYPERYVPEEVAPAAKAMAEQRVAGHFDILDRHLADNGPYLLGRDFSAADFYLLMLARWTRNMARPARDLVHIRTLIDRAAARPAVERAFAAEGIAPPWY